MKLEDLEKLVEKVSLVEEGIVKEGEVIKLEEKELSETSRVITSIDISMLKKEKPEEWYRVIFSKHIPKSIKEIIERKLKAIKKG